MSPVAAHTGLPLQSPLKLRVCTGLSKVRKKTFYFVSIGTSGREAQTGTMVLTVALHLLSHGATSEQPSCAAHSCSMPDDPHSRNSGVDPQR